MKSQQLFLVGLLSMSLSVSAMARGDVERDNQDESKIHRHQQHHPRSFMRAFAKLDLTEQQKSQLESLREQAQAERTTDFSEHKNKRDELTNLLDAEVLDEAAIKSLHQQLAEERANKMIAGVKYKRQALAILTDEQRAELAAMEAKHAQRKDKRKARHHH